MLEIQSWVFLAKALGISHSYGKDKAAHLPYSAESSLFDWGNVPQGKEIQMDNEHFLIGKMKQNYHYFPFHFLSVEVLGKQCYFQTPKFGGELDTSNVAIQTPIRIRHYVRSCNKQHIPP